MILFLSLAGIKPYGTLSRQVMAMTTVQVLEQLHTKLTREMWSDKPRVDFLAMVHWLMVKSGGVSHVEIQKTLSSVERIVPELMSQDHAVEPIGNVNIAAVLETLPRCRALSGHYVNMEFIQKLAHQLEHVHVLAIAVRSGMTGIHQDVANVFYRGCLFLCGSTWFLRQN
jgi:hypothetical protein